MDFHFFQQSVGSQFYDDAFAANNVRAAGKNHTCGNAARSRQIHNGIFKVYGILSANMRGDGICRLVDIPMRLN